MSTQGPLVINGTRIEAGSRRVVDIPLPSLYGSSAIGLRVHVIRGRKDGPTLCVTAAIHGDEVNGVEIVRRILGRKSYRNLCGTLIAVPIANPYGFLYQDRYLMDRRDLNRSFPGSKSGSLAARLAYTIAQELIQPAQYHIDLHSGSLHRTNLPQIRVSDEGGVVEELGRVFDSPVMLIAKERESSLRSVARSLGVHSILYEGGEAHRFDELTISVGVRGVLKVMQHLGMLAGRKSVDLLAKSRSSLTHSSYWVRSPHSGVFRHIRGLGKRVKKGDVIGVVGDPTGPENHTLCAPSAGIVIGLNRLPLVHEGQALFHIASFDALGTVAKEIQSFQTEYTLSDYVELETHPQYP